MLILLRFLNDDLNRDEIAMENGFDLLMLDKLIEPLAPPSPGGAEINKDGFPLPGCFLPRVSQHLIRIRRGGKSAASKCQHSQSKNHPSHDRTLIRPPLLCKVNFIYALIGSGPQKIRYAPAKFGGLVVSRTASRFFRVVQPGVVNENSLYVYVGACKKSAFPVQMPVSARSRTRGSGMIFGNSGHFKTATN